MFTSPRYRSHRDRRSQANRRRLEREASRPFMFEQLEQRLLLSTLNDDGAGHILYTVASDVADTLTVNINVGGKYVFTAGENITVAGAGAANWDNTGTPTVTGTNATVSSITIILGNRGDTLTLLNVEDPTTVDLGEGDDTINIAGGFSAAIDVSGGEPSASDVLNLTGAATTAETVTIAPDSTDSTRQEITGLGHDQRQRRRTHHLHRGR